MESFNKILFPTDFSINADRAVAHAIRLADLDDAEIIVQHVVGDYFEEHPHWTTLFDIHELQNAMDAYVSVQLASVLPKDSRSIRVRTLISEGKAAVEIAAASDREKVDLVVMGSTSGVITSEVVRLSHRPVLAVSAAGTNAHDGGLRKLTRILVATDFSEHSKRVVEYAFDLKRIFDATIYLLYVIEPSYAIEWAIRQGHLIHGTDRMKAWAGSQLRNLTPDEFCKDPRTIHVVEMGVPDETIAHVSRAVGADLTILGTHEHGLFYKHLHGTTTRKLLNKTATPVLAIKLQ